MEIHLENERDKGDKKFFDLIFSSDFKIKINNCFVEEGEKGDWMLRLPTKASRNGFFQVIWLSPNAFEEACVFVRNYFTEEE